MAGQGYAAAALGPDHVAELRAAGHSFRTIAAMLGASLGAVQRALKRRDRLAAAEGGQLALLDAEEGYQPIPVTRGGAWDHFGTSTGVGSDTERTAQPIDSPQVRSCGAVASHRCGGMTMFGAYSKLPNSVAFLGV